jgi:hypothetical protein
MDQPFLLPKFIKKSNVLQIRPFERSDAAWWAALTIGSFIYAWCVGSRPRGSLIFTCSLIGFIGGGSYSYIRRVQLIPTSPQPFTQQLPSK